MGRISFARAGVELVADLLGRDHERSVLFLHTGGENRTVWSPIANPISAAGWRTVAPDLRGHGESGRASSYLLDEFLADTIALTRALAGAPVVLVGGSLGGVIALLLAGEESPELQLPEIGGVVLLDIGPAPRVDAGARERAKIARARALRLSEVSALDPRLISSALVDDILAQGTRIRRAARRIRVPVLLIHGSRSHVIGEEDLRRYREDIPHGLTARVDAGHLVARDQPSAVTALLARFLTDASPRV